LDQTPSYRHQPNEGEGNKTAAREYNEAQHRFAQSGKVEEKAREAAKAMDSPERAELERAEAIGKRRQATESTMANSAQMLAHRASQQANVAGDYLARNVHEYPFGALVIAGLIGYGIGFLIHRSWYSETWDQGHSGEPSSAPLGHSGDVLRPLE
jgi:ElaB/YqjD/DUF883 family membrane-anchored ribosome-binding protein